jgi:hypothetical protein
VLVAPTRLDRLTPAAFARIPLEGLALVGIGLLLPPRPRRVAAAAAGIVLSLLAVVKILDLGFNEHLGRPFNPVLDWGSFGPAIGVVRDSLGDDATDVLLVLTGLGVALLVALVTASAVRISSVTAHHRRRSVGGAAVLAVAWVLSAALSLQLVPGAPVASTSSADLAVDRGRAVQETVRDQQRFRVASSSADPYADIPADDLLTDLRGKTVLVAFVESYGRSAVEGTSYARGVTEVLRRGNAELASAGLSARSAFLDSPTFGGASWLAHATLQSGLWISDQQRYDELLASPRFTLSVAFGKAGWRTVSFNPANRPPWPAGASFYRFDQLYHRYNVGYEGPRFSWAAMPDQFALAAFERLELAPGHPPVMAEIDLVTSHQPWTPLPDVVPWDQLGDGSIFEPMAARGLTPDEAWRDTETVRRLYGQSIEYSLQVLVDWVVNLDDEDVVLVLLGDHQPIAKVSGPEANHQVPISVVAHDPAVLEAIDAWEWEEGLLPGPTAPVWRMSDFRNGFLEAFSTPAPPR